MEKNYISCKKNTTNENFSVRRTKQIKLILVSSCATCGKQKLRFFKNQEANRLLRKLGIRTPLSNIPLIGCILFKTPVLRLFNKTSC